MYFLTHKSVPLKRFVAGLMASLFIVAGISGATVFADKPTQNKQTFALACSLKGTHIQVHSTDSIGCSSDGHDSPNVVTVQGIGPAKDSTKPYPNTVELTTVDVTCSGSGNAINTPKLGSTITGFTCQNGQKADVKKDDVIDAAKKPKKKIQPYDATESSPGDSGDSPKACTDQTNALCAPTSGVCSDGVCKDAAADPNADCSKHGCDFVDKYINPSINLLSLTFGLIAVISLIQAGIQYIMSTGDPQKTSQAKSRITNTIIAVIAYLFLYSFLQFLVPGGLFN
jgi:hypothetical protein